MNENELKRTMISRKGSVFKRMCFPKWLKTEATVIVLYCDTFAERNSDYLVCLCWFLHTSKFFLFHTFSPPAFFPNNTQHVYGCGKSEGQRFDRWQLGTCVRHRITDCKCLYKWEKGLHRQKNTHTHTHTHTHTQIQRVTGTAGMVISCSLPSLDAIASSWCVSRAKNLVRDHFHPTHQLFSMLTTGRRYRLIKS